ncbi:hypothetical protein GQ44DRAFT_213709 [Phaeosphaeriaceae sp. PMI808]|nr:hypothetical protein GQ44DRAFT_213709 [Phaeosphaeriaceae sp. PMI808]
MLASPLLRLPAELRVEISKYVFKQSIPIRYNQVYWGCPYSTTVLDMTSPDYFPIHHRYKYSDHWSALAMACRQLYSENGTLAWQMQDFQVSVFEPISQLDLKLKLMSRHSSQLSPSILTVCQK